MKKRYSSLFALLFFALNTTFAQVSDGGQPLSFELSAGVLSPAGSVQLPKPNIPLLLEQDVINDALGRAHRVGALIQVNLSPMNSGTWTTLPDGSKIWQLQIKSKDALALGLYFSEEVVLPAGSKLFAFNKNKNHIIGAYTSNTPRFQAMQMVEGDVLTLEYHAPAHLITYPTIKINEVGYFYRGVDDFVNQFRTVPTVKAQSCQVDVVCTPESNNWAEQIRSVVHYTFNEGNFMFVCSAATINNTANDCKPYILTAWHCGERNAGSSIASWVWSWNYQKTTCQPNSNSSNPSKGNQTMTGGAVRASSGNGTLNNPPGNNQVAGSDFYLVELNSAVPTAYNPYFAGWDRSNTAATSGVSIHHPDGSAKKISTYTATLQNAAFNGGGNGHFWRVVWSATTNGHGVTEGGSSGSPIFNQNRLIVGQLTGGSSFCNATSQPDFYGKLRSDWDLCGTTNTSQLKPWLDPTNSGVMTLLGLSCASGGGGGGGGYCPATSTHSCATQDEYIANVTLNTINNTSACGQYSNFTAQTTTLVRGQQYTVSVGTAIVGSQNVAYLNNQIAVWIDYNNDQTFAVSERIGITTVAQNTPFPIQYTFTVPQGASLGNVRMRVRLNYQPDDGNIGPCDTYAWGETEDYTINIVSSGGGSGVGIEDETTDALSIYPNPSSGEFFIDATQLGLENFSLQVFDVQGALLHQEDFNASDVKSLNLSRLAKGVYNIRLISGDYVVVKRVVIQ